MFKTIEAVVDENGLVRLLEDVKPLAGRRALVTILEDQIAGEINEAALLSEPSLAEDWNRVEEDKAWSHLKREQ